MSSFAPNFRSSLKSQSRLGGDRIAYGKTGEILRNHAHLLLQLHVWTAIVGSAALAALILSVFDGGQPRESRYAYEIMDGIRCLVDEGSNTFVNRADGAPEGVQWKTSPASIAQR